MPECLKWTFWAIAGAIVIGAGIALAIASGGSATLMLSATMVASYGLASTSIELTVASFAFVGASLGFIGASMMASRSGDMLDSGLDVFLSTAFGYGYGIFGGYYSFQDQIGENLPSWTTIRRKYWKSKGYSKAPIGSDGYPMELNHTYGRYGTKIYKFEEMTHTQHVQFHKEFGYGRGTGGFNMYYPFKNIWWWLKCL